VMNIGPTEQRKRLIVGVAAATLGVVIAIVFIFTGINRWWRLALFLPFWIGGLGLFQRLEKT
jgi:hypothetical protein